MNQPEPSTLVMTQSAYDALTDRRLAKPAKPPRTVNRKLRRAMAARRRQNRKAA